MATRPLTFGMAFKDRDSKRPSVVSARTPSSLGEMTKGKVGLHRRNPRLALAYSSTHTSVSRPERIVQT